MQMLEIALVAHSLTYLLHFTLLAYSFVYTDICVRSTHSHWWGRKNFTSPQHSSHIFNLFEFTFSSFPTAFSFRFLVHFSSSSSSFLRNTIFSAEPSNQQINEREYMNDDTGKHVYKRIEQKKHIHYSSERDSIYNMV